MGLITRCDLCQQTGAALLFAAKDRRYGGPGQFAVVRCLTCKLVRTDPRPEDSTAYYPASYYSFSPPSSPAPRVIARARRLSHRRVTLIERVIRPIDERLLQGIPRQDTGRVLDVGCGSGVALLVLRSLGWSCSGVEIDPLAVAEARAAGLNDVMEGDLTRLDMRDRSFDVIRFWHSLEHVLSPRAQLRAARPLLRPGGTLLIGVPSFGSLLSRTGRDRSFYLDVPRHLWHFEPKTLTALVEDEGYRVESIRLVSDSEPLLGTLELFAPRARNILRTGLAWRAALPFAAALDLLGAGDAMEMVASVPVD